MLPMNFSKTASFIADLGAVRAALTWKPFSFAAYHLMKGLKAQECVPLTVIDVGANEGQFTRAILQTFSGARVFAFEPLPMAAQAFERHFGGDSRVQLQCCACGVLPGKSEININAFSQSSSLLSLGEPHRSAFPSANEIGKATIDVVRLDDALRGSDFAVPALLKVDVQGYEMHVLQGAEETLGRVQHVLIETCFVPMYEGEPTFEKVMGFLGDAGFRFVGPLSLLWDDAKGIAMQMDALFERQM